MYRLKRLLSILLFILFIPAAVNAQEATPPTAIVLSTEGGLTAGMLTLPGSTLYIDYHPLDSARYARVDGIGMLRFIPAGGAEGVYSFSPYHEGFAVASAADNTLFIAEVSWSPNGEMLAFRVSGGDPGGSDGVWFWQPAREIATDPSYHLLRDCPPGCNLVTPVNAAEWRSLPIEWSSDNSAILVALELPQEENRRAVAVVYAVRDPNAIQSRTGPGVLRYGYGHWAGDGQRIIVSGDGPDGVVVFGSIARDGSTAYITPAAEIGMDWVQDAVHQPDTGQILMLGSPLGRNNPLQIVDNMGNVLTPPIGDAAPDDVSWSPDNSAVLLTIGERYYVAQTDGTVTEITATIGDIPAIDWVDGSLPPDALWLALSAPIATPKPEETHEVTLTIDAGTATEIAIGQLLQVEVEGLDLYAEPIATAAIVTTIPLGEALIVTGGPLTDGATTWWRIQTLDHTGWVQAEIGGMSAMGEGE